MLHNIGASVRTPHGIGTIIGQIGNYHKVKIGTVIYHILKSAVSAV